MHEYLTVGTALSTRRLARFQHFIPKRFAVLGAAAAMLVFGAAASAAQIGQFGFTTDGVLVFQNALAQNFIDWCPTNAFSPTQSPACGVAAVGIGTLIAEPGTGGFATLAVDTPGTIRDTTDTAAAAGANFAFLPPTAGTLPQANWISNYLTLSGHSNWNFTATQLEQVSCQAIPDQQFCVGPFKLTQTGTGSDARTTVTINVDGLLFDSSDGSSAKWLGIITGQYVNHTINQVLAEGQTANGIFSNTVSATVVTSAIPEPATMLLGGLGLIAIGFARRRRTVR